MPRSETKRHLRWPVIAACLAATAFCLLVLISPLPAQSRPESVKSVRLYVFDLGTLKVPDPVNFGFKKEQLANTDLSVVGYLIVHPKGTLLWDTGVVLDSEVGTAAKGADRAGKRTLAAQLAEIGYTPRDITYLALSHYHGDHAANANAYRGSTWIVQAPEREAMFSDPPMRTVNPTLFNLLKDSPTITLHNVDEYDVFGDGSVMLKAAYGHTPGSQILVVRLKKSGPIALVGDLYHYPEERQARTIVPNFEYNKDQSIASRNRIEDYLKKIGAQMWIEHDYALHLKLKKSPKYYD